MRTLEPTVSVSSTDDDCLDAFAATGSEAAFREIVRRYLPLVLSVTRRRLGSSGLAEDAAQQVFIALSRRARVRGAVPCLVAWLQRAAVLEASTTARREARHRARVKQAAQDIRSDDPSEFADVKWQALLDRALAHLPERDRQILLLHHGEKRSYREISARLGLSEAAAQRRGHRALEKLSSGLGGQGFRCDERACASWLALGLVTPGMRLPSWSWEHLATPAKLAFPMAWIGAAVAVVGVAALGVSRIHEPASIPPPLPTLKPGVTGPGPVEKSTASTRRAFPPKTPDDQLPPDIREFIERAKVDAADAWQWAQAKGLDDQVFFLRDASRALADRDLPATDRLLEVVEGSYFRQFILVSVFASRAKENFIDAIVWLDGLPRERDHYDALSANLGWQELQALDPDLAGALEKAKARPVRSWLIDRLCGRMMETDEDGLAVLAERLDGREKVQVAGYRISLMLQRGNKEEALRLLDECKPMELPDTGQLALAAPREVLQWVVDQEDGGRRNFSNAIWANWCRNDVRAAIEWVDGLDETRKERLGSIGSSVEKLKQGWVKP